MYLGSSQTLFMMICGQRESNTFRLEMSTRMTPESVGQNEAKKGSGSLLGSQPLLSSVEDKG